MNLDLLPKEIRKLAETYRSSPHLLKATNHFAKGYLDNYNSNFVLNNLSSNELNDLIIAYLIYLHYWRNEHDPTSGATLSQVQAFCAERGLAGPRRIATLFGVVQAAGYFKREIASIDEGERVLRPTPKLLMVLRGIVNSYIEAIEIIEQTGHYRNYINSSPDAVIAIVSHGFRVLYMNGVKVVDAVDELKPFLQMDSALKIIYLSYLHRNKNSVYDTSFKVLSKTYGISRTQAQRVLMRAEINNQLKILSKREYQIQLMPSMIDLVETYISIFLAAIAVGVHKAIDFDKARLN